MAKKKPVILLVEDDQQIQELNKSYLITKNFQVLTAESVKDALGIIIKNWSRLDVVILDIKLTDDQEGGLTLAKFLRQKLKKKELANLGIEALEEFDFSGEIIVISGEESPLEAKKFQEYDIAGYLLKPFIPPDLEVAIQTCLQKMEEQEGPEDKKWDILYEWGEREEMIRQMIADEEGNMRKSGFWRRRGKLSICIPVVTGRCPYQCIYCSHTYADKSTTRKETPEDMINTVKTALSHSLFKPLEEGEQFEVAFVGEGDPGNNLNHTIDAIHQLAVEFPNQISKVVVSTIASSVVRRLMADKFALPVQLQLSITFTGRNRLNYMPRSSPLIELLLLARHYYEKSRLPVLLNYILIKDLTDTDNRVSCFIRVIEKIGPEYFKVKLSNYNPIANIDWQPSEGRARIIKGMFDDKGIASFFFRIPRRRFERIPAG